MPSTIFQVVQQNRQSLCCKDLRFYYVFMISSMLDTIQHSSVIFVFLNGDCCKKGSAASNFSHLQLAWPGSNRARKSRHTQSRETSAELADRPIQSEKTKRKKGTRFLGQRQQQGQKANSLGHDFSDRGSNKAINPVSDFIQASL